MNQFLTEIKSSKPTQTLQQTWNWVDLLLILVGMGLIFLAGFISMEVMVRLGITTLAKNSQPSILQSLGLATLEFVALVGSVYFLGMRRRGVSWAQIGLRSIHSHWVSMAIGITLVGIPISGVISLIVLLALGLPLENPQLEFLVPKSFSWYGGIGMLIIGGFAVPFAEELLFRGVIYTWLKERWGIWTGILVSSLTFGLVHLDVAVGVTAFVLGILLAWVYERSGSLWTSILIHTVNNSLKILTLYILVAFRLVPGI